MYEFHPYYTNDGSVGLYNESFNDIYHSATGALSEAYEKFIYPIDFDILLSKQQIKILDICYGIGYNSKSFLNFLLENFLKKISHSNHNIVQIYTNNINNKLSAYNDKIYSDNDESFKNIKKLNHVIYNEQLYSDKMIPNVSVTAVDNDKILAYLSPFIKTGEKHNKNKNINFEYHEIDKFLDKNNNNNFPKINKLINYLIFDKLLLKNNDFLTSNEVDEIINNNIYKQYFDSEIMGLYCYYKSKTGSLNHISSYKSFLHNIYYKHVSNNYKRCLKTYKLEDISFDIIVDDARHYILNNCNKYNVIFLDAFTPSKCPCLWSYEFLLQLYNNLEPDGMLLTYSTSAAVRGAMLEAGLYIGNIKSQKNCKIIGTIASNSKHLIKEPLSEYDLGLIKTRAGIFYRDKNLTGQNEAIIAARKNEVANSTRITTSQYKKQKR